MEPSGRDRWQTMAGMPRREPEGFAMVPANRVFGLSSQQTFCHARALAGHSRCSHVVRTGPARSLFEPFRLTGDLRCHGGSLNRAINAFLR